jgi:hypothetical protein
MLTKSLSIVIVGCATLLCAACDGAIKVKAKVYAQANSSGESRAFVDEPVQLDPNLKPVKDAKVTLYHGADYSSKEKIDKSTLWQNSGTTGPEGEVVLGGTTSPSPSHAALVVEQPGYKPLAKIFLHDKLEPHQAVIILVPDSSPSPNVKNR